MAYLVTVEVRGPQTGSELEIGAMAGEAAEAVRECARRGLQPSLPGADVVWVAVKEEKHERDGRMCAGHRVIVAINVPEPLDRDGERDERWLRFWVESEVSVALLELINPMTVEGVSVTPVAGGHME